MVALLAHLISSFRCLLSPFVPSIHSWSLSSSSHPWNIPLPQVMHKELSEEFVSRFDEVLIIGDVHGCYDELMQLLSRIGAHIDNASDVTLSDNSRSDDNNNSRKILKLFVGDLVNKGPKNGEVLQYLIDNSDSCLSVRGNHDEVVLREYFNYKRDQNSLSSKNMWIKDLSEEQIDYLVSLPYTIRIRALNLVVVHAGLIPNIPMQSQPINDMVNMRNLIIGLNNSSDIKATSNDKEGEPWAPNWNGPEHVYFGHDAKRQLQKSAFATGLDTGCVYGRSLTAVFAFGPRKGTFVNVTATKVHSQPKGPLV